MRAGRYLRVLVALWPGLFGLTGFGQTSSGTLPVYPGVDLVYYGNQRQLEYDFVVAPGASSKPIRLQFAGAKKLDLTTDGDLTVSARKFR
jgi:hypothetical protein